MQRLLSIIAQSFARDPAATAPDLDEGLSAADRGDLKDALRIFMTLAETGDVRAQYVLALMYEEGQGVAQDYVKAVSWVRRSAEADYAPAQNNLGCALSEGRGVPQDHASAVSWFMRAGRQGDPHACFNLAECFADGEGVAQDEIKALAWYAIAEEQGNPEAGARRAALAELLSQDDTAAAEWLVQDLRRDLQG